MQKRRLFEYAVSVLAVLTAVAITVLSEPWIARQTLFVFLGAVILSTIYGGLIPGLLALGLAAIATALVVIAPLNQFRMDDGLPRWILFQIVAFIVILIIASRRNVMIRLGESSERLRLALEVARTGVWDYSRETGQLWMSQGLITMLGYPESQAFTYDEFLKAVHPEDREIFSQALDRIVNDKVDYETDFRIVRPDGAVRYLVMRGRSYASMFGGARRIVGVVTDRTNLMPAVSVTGRKLVQSSAEPVQSI